MDHAALVAAARREHGTFVDALGAGFLTAPVPTCPDWSVADLATHVGTVCRFWADVLSDGAGTGRIPVPDPPPPGPALTAWVAACGRALVAGLEATPADTTVWTWDPRDRTAGFVARRCAHELAMHRHDLQAAHGDAAAIQPALAADGIEEALGPLVTAWDRIGSAHGETIHLHGTDPGLDAEWLVTLEPDRVVVVREHAKGDLALRGSVSDLLLVLYGRSPLGPVERFGDETALDTWRRAFRF